MIANFGGCYGCAIGFSITAAMEIVYWVFIKPFGLPQTNCTNCTKHHYPSPAHKWISRFLRSSAIAALLIFSGYRFFLVFSGLFFYTPNVEETRNQILHYGIWQRSSSD
jgi:hypothetical protein